MAERPPRVLLKLSGEALCAPGGRGFDVGVATPLAAEIAATAAAGVQLAVVVGAGNLFRGAELQGSTVPRDSADRMGMLATLMNGVFLRDVLIGGGTPAVTLTGIRSPETADTFSRRRAVAALEAGQVVICAGGTGHPYFTTDTAAALRALEIGADRLLKATKVDGVYSADPEKDPDATRYDAITFDACLHQNLRVLDQAAFALCRDNGLEIVVFDMREPGAIARAALGEAIGTRVHA
jgi:uridylate kinase